MQSSSKFPQFTIKHVEPIKIRKVRVSSKKIMKYSKNSERTTPSDRMISQRLNNNSEALLSSNNSQLPRNFTSTQNSKISEYFGGIKEINENLEKEEDSLIIELNELLSQLPKDKPTIKDHHKKPPIVSIKMKLNSKLSKVKTERHLSLNPSNKKFTLI